MYSVHWHLDRHEVIFSVDASTDSYQLTFSMVRVIWVWVWVRVTICGKVRVDVVTLRIAWSRNNNWASCLQNSETDWLTNMSAASLMSQNISTLTPRLNSLPTYCLCYRLWTELYNNSAAYNPSTKFFFIRSWLMSYDVRHRPPLTMRLEPLRMRRITWPVRSRQIFPKYLKSLTPICLFTMQPPRLYDQG